MVEEAPYPPVISSAKGDKIDPVAAQMASYMVCLRSSARFALVRTSLRGSCSSGPPGPFKTEEGETTESFSSSGRTVCVHARVAF
jgi:hypothetical protein